MKFLPFILLSAAIDPATPGNPTSSAGAPPAQQDAAPLLSFGAQLKAALSSKTAMATQVAERDATIVTLQGSITAKDEELVQLNAALAASQARVTALESQASEVQAALAAHQQEVAALQGAHKSAERLAQEHMATLGVPKKELPAPAAPGSSASSVEDQIAALNEQIKATTDPMQKGRLSQQVWDLMKGMGASGKN